MVGTLSELRHFSFQTSIIKLQASNLRVQTSQIKLRLISLPHERLIQIGYEGEGVYLGWSGDIFNFNGLGLRFSLTRIRIRHDLNTKQKL